MRKGRLIVVCLTAVFIFLIAAVFFAGTNLADETLTFVVQSGDNTERIKCWKDEEGKLYVFLPAYAQLSDVKICVSTNAGICIGDIAVENGMCCSSFRLGQEYRFSDDLKSPDKSGKICFVQSANIPTMYIETESGNMDYIHKNKGNEELCNVKVYTKTGSLNYEGDLAAIKGRGNSTWNADKKPYSITLNTEGNLLEMGSSKKWILLANALDESSLSNKIAYDLAKEVNMKYSPDCTWVDLYLNGEYAGLYLLSEKVEIGENRVDISEENGFLLSAEAAITWYEKEEPKISTDNAFLRIHYSPVIKSSLEQIWKSAENAILSDDGIDHITGKYWLELIDLDSWAMRFLLDETMANYDGGVQSQFYYGDISDGKIYAGPVWDMDACLGKGVYPNQILLYGQAGLGFSPYYKLFQKQEFYDRAVGLYKTVFLPSYEDLLDGKFMQYAELISQSAYMNQIRWNTSDFNEIVKTRYDFLKNRIAFLNDFWLSDKKFCEVYIVAKGADWKTSDLQIAVPVGETIPISFDQYSDNWYDYNTNEKIRITDPIYDDIDIWHEDAIAFNSLIENMDMDEIMQLRNTAKAAIMEPEQTVSVLRIAPILILISLLFIVCVVEKVKRNGENGQ